MNSSAFVLFGPDHLIALTLVALASLLAFRAGQGPWARPLNTAGGVVMAILAVSLWGMRLDKGFQGWRDLPLALCDVAFLLCLACFVRPRPVMLALVTYWGLAGTLQALVTPDVLQAFPSKEFLLFFVGHSVIVLCVFFLLGKNTPVGQQGPPPLAGAWGVGVAFAGLLVYTVTVGAADAAFGWNYGYLRAKPAGRSVLDHMGPWPVYIGAGLLLALVLFLLVAGVLRILWKLFPGGDAER